MEELKKSLYSELHRGRIQVLEELSYYIDDYSVHRYAIYSIIKLLKEINELDNTINIVEKYIGNDPSNKEK